MSSIFPVRRGRRLLLVAGLLTLLALTVWWVRHGGTPGKEAENERLTEAARQAAAPYSEVPLRSMPADTAPAAASPNAAGAEAERLAQARPPKMLQGEDADIGNDVRPSLEPASVLPPHVTAPAAKEEPVAPVEPPVAPPGKPPREVGKVRPLAEAEGKAKIPGIRELLIYLKPGTDTQEFAKDHELVLRQRMLSDPDGYVFAAASPEAAKTLVGNLQTAQGADPRVRNCFLNGYVQKKLHFYPNDPYFAAGSPDPHFPGQWHLFNGAPGTSCVAAWGRGLTGQGVTIGVMDDCLEVGHPDLAPNYVAADSYDFGQHDSDPSPVYPPNSVYPLTLRYPGDMHGTSTSGVAAARGGNGIGGTGAAPFAGLAGIRMDFSQATPLVDWTDAMTFHSSGANTNIKVKNHSYGPTSPFVDGSAEMTALATSVSAGTIHCWSAGNDRNYSTEDANKEQPQNSPDAICVAALGSNGLYSSYSDYGACVFITASSNGSTNAITTTDLTGKPFGYNGARETFPDSDYTSRFGGTSSAAPLAAGIMALAKQAQPNLNTRFVKHLLVRTATKVDTSGGFGSTNDYSGWMTNGAGFTFNQNYGFGLINADLLTQWAVCFSGVTALTTESHSESNNLSITDNSPTGVSKTFSFTSTTPLEEVLVALAINHNRRGDLAAYLTSPSGKTSRLMASTTALATARQDTDSFPTSWTFTTNAFWGENPSGTWTVTVADLKAGTSGTWTDSTVQTRMGQLVATNPTVVNVTSPIPNGVYLTGAVIPVTVQFDRPVTVASGTPRLQLAVASGQVNYSSGSGTDTLTFNYTVIAGDQNSDLDYSGTGALTFNGATIQDVAGHNATLTLPAPGASHSLGANKNLSINPTGTYTWNTTNGNWGAGGSWVGGVAPTSSYSNRLIFPTVGAGYTATNDLGTFNLESLIANATTNNSIGGSALSFASTNAAIDQNSSGTFTVANTIALTGDLALRGSGTGAVTLNGALSGPSSAGLLKYGTHTVTLGTANSYDGPTTISAGTLLIGTNNALGTATGGTTVLNGGTLCIQNPGAPLNYSTVEPLTLNGPGASGNGALHNVSGTNTFAGPITLGSDSSIGVDASALTLPGVISGNYGLTKVGTGGTLILSGTNTYGGATTVSEGELMSGAAGVIPDLSAVTVNDIWELSGYSETVGSLAGSGTVSLGTASLTVGGDNRAAAFSGAIGGSGAVGLIKQGLGAQTLSGNNYYSGSTTVAGGTLLADNTNPIQSSTGYGSVTVQSGATLSGKGRITGSVTVQDGGTVAPYDQALPTNIATLTTGPLNLRSTSGITLRFGNSYGTPINDKVSVSGNLTLDGVLTIVDGGMILGTYTIITYSGSLTNNGLQVVRLPSTFDDNDWHASINTATAGQVKLVVSAATNLRYWAGRIGYPYDPSDGNWNDNNCWNTKWNGTGSWSMPSSGASTHLYFYQPSNATNKYTATNNFAGTFQFNRLTLDSFSTFANVITSLSSSNVIEFVDDGENEPLVHQYNFGYFLLNAPVSVNTTLHLEGDYGGPVDLHGTGTNYISGSGGLVVDSDGNAQYGLWGDNTFTGGVVLKNGFLDIGRSSTGTPPTITSGPVGTGTLTLQGGIIRAYGTATPRTVGNAVALSTGVVFGSSQTDTDNALTFSGATTLTRDATLFVYAPVTFSGAVSGGSYGLAKEGSGTLTFSGSSSNTYTGLTYIRSGTLLLSKSSGNTAVNGPLTIGPGTVQLSVANQIVDTSAVRIDVNGVLNLNNFSERIGSLGDAGTGTGSRTVALGGATLTTGDGTSTTFSGVVSGTGALWKEGSGTFSLTGTSTYSGTTTVNAGTLLVHGTLDTPGGTVTVASGATLGGNGTINRPVTVNGTLAPGASVGTLTVSSADFSSGGTLRAEVQNTSSADRLAVLSGGALTLGGTSGLVVDFMNQTQITSGSVTIATFSTLTGNSHFNKVAWRNNSGLTVFDVAYSVGNIQLTFGSGPYGGTPTPVRVCEFAAEGAGGGALVKWGCGSELENAGFHVWRRENGAGDEGWIRRSETLIPGALTTAGRTEYAWYDRCEGGAYEYRLESVSADGVGEPYEKLASVTVGGAGEITAPERNAPEAMRAAYAEYLQRGARAARVAELQRAAAGATRRLGQVTALILKPTLVGCCGGQAPRSVLASAPVWAGVSELLLGVKAAQVLAAGTELAWLPPTPSRLEKVPAREEEAAERLGGAEEPGTGSGQRVTTASGVGGVGFRFPFEPRVTENTLSRTGTASPTSAGGSAAQGLPTANSGGKTVPAVPPAQGGSPAPPVAGGPSVPPGGGEGGGKAPALPVPPRMKPEPLPPTWAGATTGPVAKVVYRDKGVLLVPEVDLPPGFDAGRVTAEREGQSVLPLARTSDGLLLYAPGYEDEYTDRDVFFLRPARSRVGLPPPPQPGTKLFRTTLPVQTTTEATATERFHEVWYNWGNHYWDGYYYEYPGWFSRQYLTDGSVATFTVSTPGALSQAGMLSVGLWSFSDLPDVSPDHTVAAFVNGQAVGEVGWDGGHQALTLSFAVPAGVLKDGANTVELVTPVVAGVSWQFSMVYSVSLSYTRKLESAGALAVAASSGAAVVCEAKGFPTREVYVVDRTAETMPRLVGYDARQAGDGTWTVRFVRQPRRVYEIVPRGAEQRPLSVTLRYIEPLRGRIGYLAVGGAEFEEALSPLLERRTAEGLGAVFADQERLFDAYGYGRYGPEGIRRAVRAAVPAYLLLVGRTTYDYRNYEGQNLGGGCPTLFAATSTFGQSPGDAQYGDLGRGYPEVAVGRYPANNAADLSVAVARTLSYTGRASASGPGGLMVADRLDPSAGDFAAEGEELIGAGPRWAWERSYLGVTEATAGEVTARLTEASGWADVITFVGHGSSSYWAKEVVLDAGKAGGWSGNVVLVQATCNGNYFLHNTPGYGSIAKALLFQGGGGVAASVGSGTWVYPQAMVPVTKAVLEAAQGSGVRWGEALLAGQRLAAERAQGRSGIYDDLAKSECLLGDPALPVQKTPAKPAPVSAPKTHDSF